MRIACTHTFTIEAKDGEECQARVHDLHRKINQASGRLNIGFEPGFICHQVQPDRKPAPITDAERLFDE